MIPRLPLKISGLETSVVLGFGHPSAFMIPSVWLTLEVGLCLMMPPKELGRYLLAVVICVPRHNRSIIILVLRLVVLTTACVRILTLLLSFTETESVVYVSPFLSPEVYLDPNSFRDTVLTASDSRRIYPWFALQGLGRSRHLLSRQKYPHQVQTPSRQMEVRCWHRQGFRTNQGGNQGHANRVRD